MRVWCREVVVRGVARERRGVGRRRVARLVAALVVALGCRKVDPFSGRCQTSHVERGMVPIVRCPVPEVTFQHECGAGCRQLTRLGNVSEDPSLSCVTRGAFWWVGDGHLLRAELATGRTESVLGPFRTELPIVASGVACEGDDVVFTATVREREQERLDLVARLRDGDTRARLLWTDRAMRQTQPSPARPALAGDLVAWLWDFTVPTLWAQRGAGPAVAVRSDLHTSSAIAAAGGGLYFQSGPRIERWFPGMSVAQPLSSADGDQWAPAARGTFVAWLDQRDEPRGTARSPRNPQVYLLDTRVGRAERVTDPARRGWRATPSLSEGWLVWVDARRDPLPDREPGQWIRAEVWGRHLASGREVPLAEGVVAALPRVVGSKVFYVSPSDGTRRDLFAQDLPRM